jgi:flagellar protein FliO/FliZ
MAQPPSILPAFLAFLGVLALIPAVLWLIKRFQQSLPHPRHRLLTLVGGLPLGPRERVVIVETEGRRWMIGVTSQNISVLAELKPVPRTESGPCASAPPPTPPASEPSRQGFAAILERLRRPSS